MEQSLEYILQWLNDHAFIAFFVSAGAMVISLGVGILSYFNKRKATKLHNEQVKIQTRLLEIEQERDHEKKSRNIKLSFMLKLKKTPYQAAADTKYCLVTYYEFITTD